MQFRDNYRIDTSNVRYGGGSGGRRGIAVGGGVGGLALMLIAFFVLPNLGIDPAVLLGGGGQSDQQITSGQPSTGTDCSTVSDIDKHPECRWPAYVTAINGYWEEQIQGYRRANTQLYSGMINTACGTGQSQMGPFYCSGDETVYIDSEFMGKLLKSLGTESTYMAEAYIMAHEYGHHVQHLTGDLQRSKTGLQTGPESGGVRLELQADCYAGVWFANEIKNPRGLVENVTSEDLFKMYDAARVVGDDHIQKQQSGQVNPENWTHGSSAQRAKWLRTGLETGDPLACDTFSTSDLG